MDLSLWWVRSGAMLGLGSMVAGEFDHRGVAVGAVVAVADGIFFLPFLFAYASAGAWWRRHRVLDRLGIVVLVAQAALLVTNLAVVYCLALGLVGFALALALRAVRK